MPLQETKEKVQRILTDFLGRCEVDEHGFTFPAGSTRVFVRIEEFNDEGATAIQVTAPLLFEVPLTQELYKWVALNTDAYRFGHLGMWEDEGSSTGTIVFTHALLGDFLDPEELKWAVGAVASSGDHLDDELKSKFGGHRFHEPE